MNLLDTSMAPLQAAANLRRAPHLCWLTWLLPPLGAEKLESHEPRLRNDPPIVTDYLGDMDALQKICEEIGSLLKMYCVF